MPTHNTFRRVLKKVYWIFKDSRERKKYRMEIVKNIDNDKTKYMELLLIADEQVSYTRAIQRLDPASELTNLCYNGKESTQPGGLCEPNCFYIRQTKIYRSFRPANVLFGCADLEIPLVILAVCFCGDFRLSLNFCAVLTAVDCYTLYLSFSWLPTAGSK